MQSVVCADAHQVIERVRDKPAPRVTDARIREHREQRHHVVAKQRATDRGQRQQQPVATELERHHDAHGRRIVVCQTRENEPACAMRCIHVPTLGASAPLAQTR